ncbi:Fcf2 pre-rRNA processing-domain-containing protein [Gautieria morchelliformis]|nr:Fcf2 pre-rRNA processing-domain-containing protein [Gautieria morchelliformis]
MITEFVDESDSDSTTPEYLESLLAKAKAAAANKTRARRNVEEEVIRLDEDEDQTPLPRLDPGPSLPRPYFNLGSSRAEPSSLLHDLEAETINLSAPSQPSAPPPPPELNKDGKLMTKRQKKEQRRATAGPDWYDLPAPAAADLPRLHREVEALRLRNSLDPKRFYRKEEGEAKGIKGLPKHFAIGTILPSPTPFGTPSADNLPRAQRKRTIVDELVDDAEAKRYAKKKFLDLQGVRGERGKGTWARKQAARRGKW